MSSEAYEFRVRLSASLPREVEFGNIITIHRDNNALIYTIEVQSGAVDEIIDALERDRSSINSVLMKSMKQQVCKPVPSNFLKAGFTIIYNFYDKLGLLITRACRHLSQAKAQTKCRPARKLRAVFS